jgi:LPS-assembly protein
MIAPQQRRLPAFLALGLLLPLAAQAADNSCTVPARPLRIAAAPAPLSESLDWSSQRFSANTRGDTELSGDVLVRFGDREIRSDRLSYDVATNTLRVSGQVRYQDRKLRVAGDAGEYGDNGAQFSAARFELLQQPGRGSAARVDLRPDGAIELQDVTYTTCPPEATDWQLRARRITLDTDRMRGVGRDTRVEFKGVPILYLPWISFPLSDARQSGFLFPTLGSSSRGGAMLSIPWYWNIAPNQDATIEPTIYARRGLDLGLEYRLLQWRGGGTLKLNYLPSDRLTHSARSYQKLDAEWRLPATWRARVQAENVSDTHYFEDFANGTQPASTLFLPRRLSFDYRDDHWKLLGEAMQYQTLIDCSLFVTEPCPLNDAERPYALAPRLNARGRWDTSPGLRLLVDGEFAGFRRSVGPQGWRSELTPTLSWPLSAPGYYLRPSIGWNLTQYHLSDTAPAADTRPSRNLPLFSVDSGLQLERTAGRRALTLEPRLLYVYIPYRDQSALPVFDSGLPDPNFVALFRDNRYVGGDRIGDANKLAFGATTRMYNSSTGQQYLSATFGQTYNLETPRVSLPNETLDTRRRSNLIANFDLRTWRNLSLRVDTAWNPQQSSSDKTQVALQYRRTANQLINVGYRYDRGLVEQADVSTAWPIGRRWEFYGRSVYSLRDHKPLDNFVGLRFRGDCWGIRAVVRHSVSTRTGALDTGFYVQLELTGLSSVGTGADTFLQQSIQGYSSSGSSL